jgi:hypothetical protein
MVKILRETGDARKKEIYSNSCGTIGVLGAHDTSSSAGPDPFPGAGF